MKFGLFTEGHTPVGITYTQRYRELIEEVLHAEKWGFDFVGFSEQHFALGGISTSAPEILFAYLAAITSKIRFRHAVTLMPYRINHPLRVAEQLATQDILSNGRMEMTVGRGNTTLALRAFEVPLEETRAQMLEGLELLRTALSEDVFTFEGEYFKVPPRSLVPKPLQKPIPPMAAAATSKEMLQIAGEKGLGLLVSTSFMGFDYLAEAIETYRKAFKPHPLGPEKPWVTVSTMGYCAETNEKAREDAGDVILEWKRLASGAFPQLAKYSADYAYLRGIAERTENIDLEYAINESGYVILGDPEACIQQIERYQSVGADELFIRIDSFGHEKIMKVIEMFGAHVFPYFKDRRNIARPADEVLATIRSMRKTETTVS